VFDTMFTEAIATLDTISEKTANEFTKFHFEFFDPTRGDR